MRILLIGKTGQLGTDLRKEFKKYELIDSEFDITKFKKVHKTILSVSPDFVINTAAYHNTRLTEIYPEKAFKINSFAVKNLAETCKESGAILVHISTDCVFDGLKGNYIETDSPNPISHYGLSKYLGEKFIQNTFENYFIVRTASLFGKAGCEAKNRLNFPTTMLKLAKKGQVKVKGDEYTSIAYTKDLAHAIHQMMLMGGYGIYHLVNEGRLSWYQFAEKVFKLTKTKTDLIPISRDQKRVPRPADSSLRTIKIMLPFWEDALERYLYEKRR